MSERARQFLPFASLKGYYDIINERKNIKEPKRVLSEEDCARLNEKLTCIKKNMMLKVTYYTGDSYDTIEGMVAKYDDVYRTVSIVKKVISFDDIYDIEGEGIK